MYLCGDEVLFDEVLGDNLDGALDVDFVGLDVDLGVRGRFVRGRDTSEFCKSAQFESSFQLDPVRRARLTLDLSSPGLLVEPLGIPTLYDAQWSIHKDLDEGYIGTVLLVQFPSELSVGYVG